MIPPNNPLLASTPRLTIMLILFFYKKVGFTELHELLNITSGNLDYHLKQLANANYLQIKKVISFNRVRTAIKITKHGEDIFRDYTYKLREILNKID
ncbi:MAG: transcriptional regulator [Candidatus Hermodarchaeota archaeon]